MVYVDIHIYIGVKMFGKVTNHVLMSGIIHFCCLCVSFAKLQRSPVPSDGMFQATKDVKRHVL